ncbi:DUF4105 domain-containing protein [Psychrobacter sp. I-STPA6b]|uniref:Lnb N-terminal periplasmic domain-containing protein n=1 Tax=Psychrobacter sp. I-STPA6b TaxID=2585718 RepID=UPI001D0CC198|nr:DUF4105 domain-containing protein [Psychrobacter sp. I-STPA6b]
MKYKEIKPKQKQNQQRIYHQRKSSITQWFRLGLLAGVGVFIVTLSHAQPDSPSSVENEALLFDKVDTALSDVMSNEPLSDASSYEALTQRLNERLNEKLIQAQQRQLGAEPTWRRLLYLSTSTNQKKVQQQQAQLAELTPSFFVSSQGMLAPQEELEAMLTHMFSVQDIQRGNDSVQCRFPARTQWLRTQLQISSDELPQADCQEFKAWLSQIQPYQLSVVFAEEYLDNPVSSFGHTVMRVDNAQSAQDHSTDEGAHAVNYTVGGDPNDPFVKYAMKSFYGGYAGVFSVEPYKDKMVQYHQKEGRDTWEYVLNLTPEESRQVMRHVWEIKDLSLPYYFLSNNCAYELLHLINIVRPETDLTQGFSLATIPADIVRRLDEQNLIVATHYRPANMTIAQAQQNLNHDHQPMSNHNSLPPNNLPPNNHSSNTDNAKQSDKQQIKPETVTSVITSAMLIPADNNPLEAHELKRVDVGLGVQNSHRYMDVGLRAGYHDALDRSQGYPQYFDYEVLGARVRMGLDDSQHQPSKQQGQKLQLQELTLVRGRLLNPVNVVKNGKTWGLHMQARQVSEGVGEVDYNQHLVGSVGVEYGYSFAYGQPKVDYQQGQIQRISGERPANICYAMTTAGAQVGKGLANGFRIGTGALVGCQQHWGEKTRALAELSAPYWYHGHHAKSGSSGYWQPTASLGVQHDLSKNSAIRLQANHTWQPNDLKDNSDIQLAYLHYFF